MPTVVRIDSTHPSFNMHYSAERQVLVLNERGEAICQFYGDNAYKIAWQSVGFLSSLAGVRR